MREQRKKLGDILVAAGIISDTQLSEALRVQTQGKKKLGEVLVDLGHVTEQEIINVLSRQLGIATIDLDEVFIDPAAARCIPKEVAKKYGLIPVYEKDGKLIVAMSDPLNVYAIDDVRFLTQKPVEPVIALERAVTRAIDVYLGKQASDKAIEDLKREYASGSEEKVVSATTDDIQNAPAVRLVNSIISQAVNLAASDIHVEPYEHHVLVRYRIDGYLSEGMTIPMGLYSAVSTRFKIMAGINIAEKRIPQDGRIEMELHGKSYDFRVSSLPTVHGEKLVIRILDRGGSVYSRDMLGFLDEEIPLIDKVIKMPYGIVLMTGPTGSGKTTTLYTFLSELNAVDKNIVTIEDPVEYMLAGINQVQVNVKAGMSFASGLRSILRQDPDIIMIGEIRDEETAQIAVRAAITGHLVLSTLHTNDAPGAVTRLVDMGVEPYLAADAIAGVIAQRLVRKLCNSCKEAYQSTESDMRLLRLDKPIQLFRPKGCPICHDSGYKGRLAIHEVMRIDTAMRSLIETGGNAEQIRVLAQKNGMINLFENCRFKVMRGVTTTSEMVKTVYARD